MLAAEEVRRPGTHRSDNKLLRLLWFSTAARGEGDPSGHLVAIV
jgi:hypothetical protein